jgi:hypothetical protein
MADGGTDHKTTNSAFNSESMARDSSPVNKNNRNVSTDGTISSLNANFLWRKRLARKGRSLSVNIRENYNANQSSGYLYSNTQFYNMGLPSYDSLVDQYKQFHTDAFLVDSKIAYTEPLSAVSFLTINYGMLTSSNHSNKSSFDKSPGNEKYDLPDSIYSNDYQFNTLTNKGGLAFSLIRSKIRFSAGSDIGFTRFDQHDLRADTSVSRKFINWYPQAAINYSFSPQRRLTIRYTGATIQPTLQQIQPVITNEDPLNITIGNPSLKPQFRNDVSLNFNDYKVLNERSIWAWLDYSNTQNAISNEVNVDSTGKRVSRSINVNGNYTLNGNLEYDCKWKKAGLNVAFYTNFNQSNIVSLVNDLPNTTHSGNYTLGNRLYKSKSDKYELGLRYSATYTMSRSSVNNSVTTDYWTYEVSPSMDIFLPDKFQIHADADVNLRPKTVNFGGNNNVVLLNAWIGKKLLKSDALVIRVSGNDLLNQNIGFNRTVNSNFISQNTYKTIKRYGMVSIIWNFTKAGAAPAGR